MVAVKANQAAAFLKAPPSACTAVLFYGTDPGLVSERSQRLAKYFAEREKPPGEVLRLDDSDLEEDTGRLAEELNTRPMFSGRRIVRATTGRRITAALLKSVLAGPPLEGLLIVEGGNLKPDDSLRTLFEGSASCAAVACYPDSDADLESLVNEVLAANKMRIGPEARDQLVSRLGADRALSRAEVEKLALYCMGKDSIALEDVEAIVGDASDLALEAIAEAAASGRAEEAISNYGRAMASGESAQAVILITQRYFLRLHKIRGEMESGRSAEEAVQGFRPPLHFRQKDAVIRQAKNWNRQSLDGALKRISEAAKAARLSSALEETLGERLILALAAMATPAAARRR